MPNHFADHINVASPKTGPAFFAESFLQIIVSDIIRIDRLKGLHRPEYVIKRLPSVLRLLAHAAHPYRFRDSSRGV